MCVSGRLTLECYNLADDDPELAALDARMIAYQRSIEPLLTAGRRRRSRAAATTVQVDMRTLAASPSGAVAPYTCPHYSEVDVAMPSQAEIFDKVREALVDALGVDDDEVTPEATLRGDLDAESIDFLDIVFRLEKAFDIKIERGELIPMDVLENTDYVAGRQGQRRGHRAAQAADAVRRPQQVRERTPTCRTWASS